ncbi:MULTISPECIES: hypothetical protein [Streptomycetaceae]|uniref:hypothetical protein n=1 Tax=Streptomycetaceae TaxID=2062 RepID=UPI003008EA2D
MYPNSAAEMGFPPHSQADGIHTVTTPFTVIETRITPREWSRDPGGHVWLFDGPQLVARSTLVCDRDELPGRQEAARVEIAPWAEALSKLSRTAWWEPGYPWGPAEEDALRHFPQFTAPQPPTLSAEWTYDLPWRTQAGWSERIAEIVFARFQAEDAAFPRDSVVRWAVASGMHKVYVHRMTGVARTTIDRIIQAAA